MNALTEFNVIIFGIHLKINRIAFTIGGFEIYWYGIIIAFGFLLAIIYAWANAKRFNLNTDKMADVILVSAPLAIFGARAYYLLFYNKNLKNFFDFKSGGLAIYGGIIVAFLSGIVMCKIRKVNIADMFDIAAIGFTIGQAIGRWGNFFNQEAFGTATGSSWFGMTSENVASELGAGALAHPCFLYESLWCAIGFVLLHILSKHRKFSGQVFLSYGVWYGFGRTIIESLRTDSLFLGTMRVSKLVSIIACVICAVLIVFFLNKAKKETTEQTTEYESQFLTEDDSETLNEESTEALDEKTDSVILTEENVKEDE